MLVCAIISRVNFIVILPYASELEKLTSDFNARLAAKQNEINQLKGINDGDNPTTTMPSNSNSASTMSPEAKLKASEQQKANILM